MGSGIVYMYAHTRVGFCFLSYQFGENSLESTSQTVSLKVPESSLALVSLQQGDDTGILHNTRHDVP